MRMVREYLEHRKSGCREVVLISGTEPASLNISGANVENMADTDIIQAGSVLITPNSNYIAFQDGVFTRRGVL